jgi:hypothetical protein
MGPMNSQRSKFAGRDPGTASASRGILNRGAADPSLA